MLPPRTNVHLTVALPLTLCGEIKNKCVHRAVNCTQCENMQRLSTNFTIIGRKLLERWSCGGTQAVGLGGRGGSSKLVLFTTQKDVSWSRRTAPFILSLCTRWNRVVRRFAAGNWPHYQLSRRLGWSHRQSGRFVEKTSLFGNVIEPCISYPVA